MSLRLLLPLAVFTATAAHAADASGCKAPDWAPPPLPGFVLHSCDERNWDSEHLYGLKGGDTDVEGHRTSVTYHLEDASKNPLAVTARDYYAKAQVAAGAAVLSKPGDTYQSYAKKVGPHGDVWLIYDHGGGSEKSTTSYTLQTIEVMPPAQEVETRPMSGELAVGGKCEMPPWIVKQLDGYSLGSCDSREWDQIDVSLKSGHQTIEGRRYSVVFKITDEKKVAIFKYIVLNYLHALEKSGATILTDAKANRVVAMQKSPAGDDWFIIEPGGGSEEHVTSYGVQTVQLAPMPQHMEAKLLNGPLDTEGCKDPAWLTKNFPTFKLAHCTNRDFDTVKIPTKDGEKQLAGRVHDVKYELTNKDLPPTQLELQQNFIKALQKIGAELISDPRHIDQAVLTQKTPGGDLTYFLHAASGNPSAVSSFGLLTVQQGGPPPKTCKLEVYGVNFDFDKATLRPDSEPVLTELLKLFQQDPKWTGEIGGHTDNVGKPDYNLKLSGERANAVKDWLVAHGVAASRLKTHGYGDTRPLVPNNSDENRAKNRRVELSKDNCKGQ